jgi:hypothetical protein
MCSTPRPRTKVAGKSASSASFLSGMSTESRRRFTEQANIAQVRREKINLAKNKQKNTDKASLKINSAVITEKAPKPFAYWLLTASLSEITQQLFLGKSKVS